MNTRRGFFEAVLSGAGAAYLSGGGAEIDAATLPGQGGAAAATGSHVGNLYPFIASQAVHGEFPLSFLAEEFKDLEAWKARGREKVFELLQYAPPACAPRAEVIERVDAGDYVREKILFNTTPDLRIPAYVLIPKGLTGPAPAIVALHDHGGFYLWGKEKIVELPDEHPSLTEFKAESYAGRSIASELARRGYVVIVIDMFYWGERRMLLDDDAADWRERPREIKAERVKEFNRRAGSSESLVARTIYSAGFTWAGVMYWDDIRTIDYLVTRPEVDPGRIGCVGLSMGGLRTIHLGALDPRIKASVAVGWMASYPAQLKERIVHTIGFTKLVPGLMRLMDYPDVASLAMPGALMVINGSKDELFDLAGVRHCFEKLRACYQKAGIPERVAPRLYETPHEFNLEMQAEAWDWLDRWLKG